jgi:hypothetical protein
VGKDKPLTVKLLYANYSDKFPNGCPDLQKDFWDAFPDGSFDTTFWKPIGKAQFLPYKEKTMTNTEPTILTWEWITPQEVDDKVWLLLVIDCKDDPIPQENKKEFNIQKLVRTEKHIGIKLVDVIGD